MSVREHLTLKDIQDLLDNVYLSMAEPIPLERKKAIEDQVSIMPLNEAELIARLVRAKLHHRIVYLERMKQNKIDDMTRN